MFPIPPNHPLEEVVKKRQHAKKILLRKELEESLQRDELLAATYR